MIDPTQPSRPLVVGLGEVLWDLLPSGKQLGGAPANFAFHADSLGARGVVVSRVGDDPLGREIFERLERVGLQTAFISVDPRHPTGTVDVRLDAQGVPQYVIHENVAWDHLPHDEAIVNLASRADAVCYGTLAQRSSGSRESIRRFLAATAPRCLRVLDINLRQHYYDRSPVDELLSRSSILKLNDQELPFVAELLGLNSEESAAMDELMRRYALNLIALTRGERGSTLFDGRRAVHHPGFRTEIVDTVGAGDAFTAALVMGLLFGSSLERISERCNRVAAFVCSQAGAMPALPQELRTEPA